MANVDTAIAVYADHAAAEAAIRKLTAAGFAIKHLSIVGKGYHTEEQAVGFYNAGIASSSGACAARSGAASGACSSAACS
jgi:hypothetical protein